MKKRGEVEVQLRCNQSIFPYLHQCGQQEDEIVDVIAQGGGDY